MNDELYFSMIFNCRIIVILSGDRRNEGITMLCSE